MTYIVKGQDLLFFKNKMKCVDIVITLSFLTCEGLLGPSLVSPSLYKYAMCFALSIYI